MLMRELKMNAFVWNKPNGLPCCGKSLLRKGRMEFMNWIVSGSSNSSQSVMITCG